MKASNNLIEDAKESYTLDRGKASNGISAKNVVFAPAVERSISSYLLNDALSTNVTHKNSMTPSSSTSQLIKQTLSPLVHYRPTQQQQSTTNALSDAKGAPSPHKMKPNSVSSSLGNYQLTSTNTFTMTNNTGNGGSKPSNFSLSSSIDNHTSNVTPNSQRTSSPSRSLSSHTNTNTLPSHVGRSNNNQYQFESNYSLKNKPKTFTSPGNSTFFNALSSISSSPSSNASSVTMANQTSTGAIISSSSATANISNSSNIYGTLPKSVANSFGASNDTGRIYGNVSAVASEFEQLIARNANSGNNGIGGMASGTSSNSHGNYNTLGSYRVQYSSTNPFLNHFTETSTTDDK